LYKILGKAANLAPENNSNMFEGTEQILHLNEIPFENRQKPMAFVDNFKILKNKY